MKFIWDESKRISNIDKHGLDFARTHLVFENDTFTFEDNRMTYNEPGRVGNAFLPTITVNIDCCLNKPPSGNWGRFFYGR